jgi:hypothetical protein
MSYWRYRYSGRSFEYTQYTKPTCRYAQYPQPQQFTQQEDLLLCELADQLRHCNSHIEVLEEIFYQRCSRRPSPIMQQKPPKHHNPPQIGNLNRSTPKGNPSENPKQPTLVPHWSSCYLRCQQPRSVPRHSRQSASPPNHLVGLPSISSSFGLYGRAMLCQRRLCCCLVRKEKKGNIFFLCVATKREEKEEKIII